MEFEHDCRCVLERIYNNVKTHKQKHARGMWEECCIIHIRCTVVQYTVPSTNKKNVFYFLGISFMIIHCILMYVNDTY